MEKLSILAQIKERDNLLSLPQALAEILRQVDDPDFSSDKLAKIIMHDPPLTGRILKVANSSMYRRYAACGPSRITCIVTRMADLDKFAALLDLAREMED